MQSGDRCPDGCPGLETFARHQAVIGPLVGRSFQRLGPPVASRQDMTDIPMDTIH